MNRYYKIYGLVIQSEIELPEAFPVREQEADVEIKTGLMPEYFRVKQEENYNFGINKRECKWFYMEKAGSFLIEKGTSILIQLENNPEEAIVRSIILGACLGCILYQREIPSLHGSAVAWKDKAIIISGDSGAGKSTISTEFRKGGCSFMADDTVAITNEEEGIYAHPAYPQQKLCLDTAVYFGYDLKNLVLINDEVGKYAVRLKDSFCPEQKKIAAIICLAIGEDDRLSIEELHGGIKLEYIIKNLYFYHDYNHFGMTANTFKKCIEVAQKVQVFQVLRPAGVNASKQIVSELISRIETNNIYYA